MALPPHRYRSGPLARPMPQVAVGRDERVDPSVRRCKAVPGVQCGLGSQPPADIGPFLPFWAVGGAVASGCSKAAGAASADTHGGHVPCSPSVGTSEGALLLWLRIGGRPWGPGRRRVKGEMRERKRQAGAGSVHPTWMSRATSTLRSGALG